MWRSRAVELDQRPEDGVPDALLLPGLETLMQDATRNAEPVALDGLPLAAGPQQVPDAVQHGPVADPGPTALLAGLGSAGRCFFMMRHSRRGTLK